MGHHGPKMENFIGDKYTTQDLLLFLSLSEVPPPDIIRLCQKGLVHPKELHIKNTKFWNYYFSKWLIINPFEYTNPFEGFKYAVTFQIPNNIRSVFEYGTDRYIRFYFLEKVANFYKQLFGYEVDVNIKDIVEISNKEQLTKMLMRAIDYGRYKWVLWLWNIVHSIKNKKIDIEKHKHSVCMSAIRGGNIKVVEWVWKITNGGIDINKYRKRTLCNAAEYGGNVEVLDWLWEKIESNNKEPIDIHFNRYKLFRTAAREGYLDILKWLQDISKIDVRIIDESFRIAARYGNIKVMQWLWKISGGTIFIHDQKEYAFRKAAKYGNLEILKWLWEISGGKIDIHIKNEYTFDKARDENQDKVVEWLESLPE